MVQVPRKDFSNLIIIAFVMPVFSGCKCSFIFIKDEFDFLEDTNTFTALLLGLVIP